MGKPSLIPQYNNISHNFFISNYNSFDGIDNDDGSSYYDISSNVFYLNDQGEYAFVPCSFLATCTHIREKITELQEYLPDWKDEIQIEGDKVAVVGSRITSHTPASTPASTRAGHSRVIHTAVCTGLYTQIYSCVCVHKY